MRFVKDGVARAIRTLRAAASPAPEDQVVPLSPQMVGLRFAAAARAAGVEARVTAHSRRVGLASGDGDEARRAQRQLTECHPCDDPARHLPCRWTFAS